MKSRATLAGPPRAAAAPPRPWRGAWTAAVPLLLAGCGEDHLRKYPQTTFHPTTEFARISDWLFMLSLYLGVAVGIAVLGILAYFLWKFRYRPGAPEPKQIHGNTRLEVAWTLIPAIILAVIAIPTVKAIFDTQPDPSTLKDAVTIEVIGKQWWWEFRYPQPNGDTVITANEIHVPVGRTVHLILKTDNVLHSFWVPQMGGKRDLITNRVNHLVFKPEEAGVYFGQCAEFCGTSHSLMRMRMVAHAGDGYQQWLTNESHPAVEPAAGDSAVQLGKQLVTTGACAGCHYIEGTPMAAHIGPALTHFGRRRTLAAGILDNNAENLHRWLANPPEVKPGSKMPNLNLTDQQITYITAYLQSLQ
ncbi:cytochrome c oxidase subunit II [Longimicrobium sp.]|uniref:cytochrome c oxidase subunit II n=1 Tax=Longimicrobium sp. TaxID=2029185 RepID=UPI002C58D6F3|nr:cytochrome c oxidase subunit II [Longimicrobium sp.]HSU16762.1 cytochrome c oxidase subunit II [Longimicrobium sp.]